MLRLDKGKIALALLCVLLAASVYGAYYFWRMPSSEDHYVATCRYQQEADFTTVVTLKPSILYENRTVLQPDEIAYLSLVNQVRVSFRYRFTCDRPMSTFLMRYSVEGSLEAEGGWRKAFTLTPEETSSETELTETYTLDIAEFNQLIQRIEEETGTYAPKYTYKIAPRIQVEASTDQGPISEKCEPTMTVTLTGGTEGRGRLDFDGLNNTREGSLGHYETREAVWSLYGLRSTVRNMQYASCVAIACLSTCLGYAAWWRMRSPPQPLIERVKRKYGEKIVESSEPPNKRIEKVTIKVKSIEDLVKTSEETIKPIIHEEAVLEKEELKVRCHIFYVLDADVRYEFTAEEIAEPKKKIAKNNVKSSRQASISLHLLRMGAVVAFIWYFYWAFIHEVFVWNKLIWESIKNTQILINYICSIASLLLIILSTVPIKRLTVKLKPKLQKE